MIINYLDCIVEVNEDLKSEIKSKVDKIDDNILTTVLIGDGNQGLYLYGLHTISEKEYEEIKDIEGEWEYFPSRIYKNYLQGGIKMKRELKDALKDLLGSIEKEFDVDNEKAKELLADALDTDGISDMILDDIEFQIDQID